MHEASLVRSLLNQEHGGGSVGEIRIEIGPLSGVEPLLVASAFRQLATETGLSAARLLIDEIPLVARCPVCGEFEVRAFCFRCPKCESSQVTVVRGDELRIVSFTYTEIAEGHT
jgi:hydrogenase nickel incorporation protein HypA/HybF